MFGISSPSAVLIASALVVSAQRAPREIGWSNQTFGPDGPWRAVNVMVGAEKQQMALYPGASGATWLLASTYCGEETCYADKAGKYDTASSSADDGVFSAGEVDTIGDFMHGVQISGSDGLRYADDITIPVKNNNQGITAEHVSLMVLNHQDAQYPDKNVPFFAGCLSLGANFAAQETHEHMDNNKVNTSLVPGWLWENEYTPSNSFGMHIGSANSPLPGSLWLGGYDQNRVVGDIIQLNGGPRGGITLRDIGIEVIAGKSPFSSDSAIEGLLAKDNSTLEIGTKVSIDGCSPYLTLPKSTCDNIAGALPVDFDKKLGLYLWDTSSEKYKEIVNSASALSFSFAGSNTKTTTIRVPFKHLDLTLSEPLVEKPTPYFPCHVSNGAEFTLGRAFLQDAFVGANWHPDVNTWWLAQAPGLNIPTTPNIVSIGEKDKTIVAGENNWKASWDGVWENEGAASEKSGASDTANSEKKSGLSTGAMAGIGVGVAAVVLALIAVAFFLWRRRRNQAKDAPIAEENMSITLDWKAQQDDQSYQELHTDAGGPREVHGEERPVTEDFVPKPPQKTKSGFSPQEMFADGPLASKTPLSEMHGEDRSTTVAFVPKPPQKTKSGFSPQEMFADGPLASKTPLSEMPDNVDLERTVYEMPGHEAPVMDTSHAIDSPIIRTDRPGTRQ